MAAQEEEEEEDEEEDDEPTIFELAKRDSAQVRPELPPLISLTPRRRESSTLFRPSSVVIGRAHV